MMSHSQDQIAEAEQSRSEIARERWRLREEKLKLEGQVKVLEVINYTYIAIIII